MFADVRRTFSFLFSVLATFSVALLLGGCQYLTPTTRPYVIPTVAGEVIVPFTTLALNESGMGVDAHAIGYEPRAFLFLGPEQIEPIAAAVTAADLELLRRVDWTQSVVIGVFRGYQGSLNYPTIVERIAAEGDSLVVYTQFWVPPDNMPSGATITAPYHLVEVRRDALPSPSPNVVLQWYTVELRPLPFGQPGAPTEGGIPFQTIDRWAGAVATGTPVPEPASGDTSPALIFINSPEELPALTSQVTAETMAKLQAVEWQRFAVVALLRGTDPSCQEPIQIIAIRAAGGELAVRAMLTREEYNTSVCTSGLRPYHIVQVSRLQLGDSVQLSLDPFWATPTPAAK